MRTNDKRRNSWLLQLTPPRGGELPSWISSMRYLPSTHAPAWGRTLGGLFYGIKRFPSTHAPAWGRTAVVPISLFAEKLQPTSPCGGERVNIRFWTRLQILQLPPRAGGEHWGTVSIPGIAKLQLTPPEWGANSGPSSQRCQQPVFNSRHRVGQTA